MDGGVDRWTEEWTDGLRNGRKEEDGRMNRETYEGTENRTDGRRKGRKDGGSDGWPEERTEGRNVEVVKAPTKNEAFVCLINKYTMNAHGRIDVRFHGFITSTLDGGK
jgi:hypothetical protein